MFCQESTEGLWIAWVVRCHMLGKSNLADRELVCTGSPNTVMRLTPHSWGKITLTFPFIAPALPPHAGAGTPQPTASDLACAATDPGVPHDKRLPSFSGRLSINFLRQTSGFPVQSSVTLHSSSPAGEGRWNGLTRSQVVHSCRTPKFPSPLHIQFLLRCLHSYLQLLLEALRGSHSGTHGFPLGLSGSCLPDLFVSTVPCISCIRSAKLDKVAY